MFLSSVAAIGVVMRTENIQSLEYAECVCINRSYRCDRWVGELATAIVARQIVCMSITIRAVRHMSAIAKARKFGGRKTTLSR
jgi:hypothetical protein